MPEVYEVPLPQEARNARAAEPDDESPTDRQALVGQMLDEARQYYQDTLEPAQSKATDYYMGKPFGNEEEGRSQVVSTDVRDSTVSYLSQLLRIFFGPERVVEYRPRGPEDVGGAEQATDYVNYVVQEDNPGFLILHSAFKDALVRKLGIIKWWWDESDETVSRSLTGLSEMDVMRLVAQDYELQEEGRKETDDGLFFNVRAVKKMDLSTARIAAVPNDEFLFSPNARSLEDARLVAHVREMRADELVDMGYPESVVEMAAGRSNRSDDLETSRRLDEGTHVTEDVQAEETRPVLYAESYVYLPNDENKIELRKVCTIGDAYEIVADEPCDERPFALFAFDPEPHTMVGLSLADYTMDSQLKKSMMERGALDSLALTLDPRTAFVEGWVNPKDILNPEVGNLVRIRREAGGIANAIAELTTPFVGKEALAMLQYENEQIENRTGRSRAAQGLNADALQSSTKTAVAATVSGSMQRVELVARIFAETGMKQLFKGLLRLIHKHQNQPRMVRLRNQFIPIDPSAWNPAMDVVTTVALGAGLTEERIGVLSTVLQEQKEQLAQGSPLVTLVEYRKTLAKILELSGYKNSDEFFRPFGPQEQQQMQEMMAQQPPPPDPQQQIIALEAEKLRQQQDKDRAELELKQTDMIWQNDRERDKMSQDYSLKVAELESRYKTEIDKATVSANIQMRRMELDADMKRLQPAPTTKRRTVTLGRNEDGRISNATIEENPDGQ